MTVTLKELEKNEYVRAIGRRKTATAQVRLYKAAKTEITINDKKASDYFPTDELMSVVLGPFLKSEDHGVGHYKITVIVSGGGVRSQAESIRLGITRCLVKLSGELRPVFKPLGFLKRDPRIKERKKFGHRKARKKEQWKKR